MGTEIPTYQEQIDRLARLLSRSIKQTDGNVHDILDIVHDLDARLKVCEKSIDLLSGRKQ